MSRLAWFTAISEHYVHPFLANKQVTTVLLLLFLSLGGWNVYGLWPAPKVLAPITPKSVPVHKHKDLLGVLQKQQAEIDNLKILH